MGGTAASSAVTKPYVLDLGEQRGVIRGLTWYAEKTKKDAQCHAFRGIPYALPPVGPFRWKPPRHLPPCYRYGTHTQPGGFDGQGCGYCPQPGYMKREEPDRWDEDCLQLNIWLPTGTPPAQGWPVLFYIHGGWLQFGSPNEPQMQSLLAANSIDGAGFESIIVLPAYRLNVFGFLASSELEREAGSGAAGNYGFQDQRLALVWTRNNISYFGGDAGNITVGGLSAGAHSTFHQLAYDLYQPPSQQIIKRVFMASNGSGVQPKTVHETQSQFNKLCENLSIPASLSAAEKLARLRGTPAAELIRASAQENMPREHEFRAVTDNHFVRAQLFEDLESGDFGRRLRQRNLRILIGEVRDEHSVYATWRPPTENSIQSLKNRLCADYSAPVVDKVMAIWTPNGRLPSRLGHKCKDWHKDVFGRVYADMQVYALSRGFLNALERGGAGPLVHRWRIEHRSKNCDKSFPAAWGVTHGTDLITVWFWGGGVGKGLTDAEKEIARPWVNALSSFVHGQDGIRWGCSGSKRWRLLTSKGETKIEDDQYFEKGLEVWDAVRQAQQSTKPTSFNSKL